MNVDRLQDEKALVATAGNEACELIQRYEGGQPAEVLPLSETERSEGLRLCARYDALYSVFPKGPALEFCPTFPGAGFLNSSEGDIGIGKSLIEVKTTTRKPAGMDIRQLMVYAALDANAGKKRWSDIGIFNPRRGTTTRGATLSVRAVRSHRSASRICWAKLTKARGGRNNLPRWILIRHLVRCC
jgi:hypothetical protein